MTDLSKKKCVPCEGGIPPFDISKIHEYIKKVDGWDVKKDNSENFYLTKEFKFKNFLESQKFVMKLVKLLKQKATTLISLLVGVMQI